MNVFERTNVAVVFWIKVEIRLCDVLEPVSILISVAKGRNIPRNFLETFHGKLSSGILEMLTIFLQKFADNRELKGSVKQD